LAFIRLLDFALLTFLVWLVWSQVIRGWRAANAASGDHGHGAPPSQPRQPSATATAPEPVTLVRCSACGVHVPSGRTLPGPAGQIFCSDGCRARAGAHQTI
jgi:hypothetical protein